MVIKSTTVRFVSVVAVISLATQARDLHAQVTFTPGNELIRDRSALRGVTFTPAAPTTPAPPALSLPRTEAPRTTAERIQPLAEPSRASPPMAPARVEEQLVETPRPSAREIAANTPVPSASPAALASPSVPTVHARTITTQAPLAFAEETAGSRCSLGRGLQTIDLYEGELRATSVLLAANQTTVVAHVSLSAPGVGREGLQFPSGRLITLVRAEADRARPDIVTPGVQPGAAIALNDEGELLVISPTRVVTQRGARAESSSLQWSILRGRVESPPRVIANSQGFSIDSPPVAWRGGWSVVLGESTNPSAAHGSDFAPIRERVYSFDRSGAPLGTPWVLTESQRPDSVSRFRVGLGAVSNESALAAVFADQNGLWMRQFSSSEPREPATRIARGPAWSPEIASDGSGVIFREDGFNGQPVRLRLAGFRESPVVELGVGWEPLASVHRGITLVAGALSNRHEHLQNVLFTESAAGQPPRPLNFADGVSSSQRTNEAVSRLDAAMDVAFVGTHDGAILAWLEPSGDAAGHRQLVVARARCSNR